MRLRFALLLGLLWLVCAVARAEAVVLACADECSTAQFQALELELRGYGVVLTARPAPAGFTPAARSADAQHVGQLLAAAVTLWVEHDEPLRLCAYSRAGRSFHEAPLPATPSALDPRVFAALAGSVALEALHAQASPSQDPPAEAATPTALAPVEAAREDAPFPVPSEATWPSTTDNSSWSRRFYIRAGAAVGFAKLTTGLPRRTACRKRRKSWRRPATSMRRTSIWNASGTIATSPRSRVTKRPWWCRTARSR